MSTLQELRTVADETTLVLVKYMHAALDANLDSANDTSKLSINTQLNLDIYFSWLDKHFSQPILTCSADLQIRFAGYSAKNTGLGNLQNFLFIINNISEAGDISTLPDAIQNYDRNAGRTRGEIIGGNVGRTLGKMFNKDWAHKLIQERFDYTLPAHYSRASAEACLEQATTIFCLELLQQIAAEENASLTV